MPAVGSAIKLLTTREAGALVGVQSRTVVGWIEKDLIPYLRLPSGEYRIPLTGFLASMSGTYNLAEELEKLDAQLGDVSEDDVMSALRDSAD